MLLFHFVTLVCVSYSGFYQVAAYVTRQGYPYECTDEQSLNSYIDEYYNYYEHGPNTDEYNYLDENEPNLIVRNIPPEINHPRSYPPPSFNQVPYNRLHPGRIRKNDYRYDSNLMTDDYNLYYKNNEYDEDNEVEDEEKEEDEENEEDEDDESGRAWQNFLSHLSKTEVLPKLFGTVSNTDRNQRRANVYNEGFRPREYENGNNRRYINNNNDNNERIILGSERTSINSKDPDTIVSNTRRRQTNTENLTVSVPVSVDEGSSVNDVGNSERRTRNSSGTVASASGGVKVAIDENALLPVEISAGASGSIGINTGEKKECKNYEKKDKKKTDRNCKKKPSENKKDEEESENSLKCFCKDYKKYGDSESLRDDDNNDEYKGEPEVIIKRKKGCKEKRKTDDDAGGGSPLAQDARILIDKGLKVEHLGNNAIVDNTVDYSKIYDAFVENQPIRLSPTELEAYYGRKYMDLASGYMKNQLFGRNNNGDGDNNNADVNKNDARDIFHYYFRNWCKGTNNFELKPRNLNPFNKFRFSKKRPPKCSHKLKIEAGPLSCRFTINGRRCSENNVKCVVVDANNCVYDFDKLTKDIQCKILEGGISEGSVFLCYPPKEIAVEENGKDTAEILLIKSVLYHWIKNIIDVCFDSPYLANRCRNMFHSMIRGN